MNTKFTLITFFLIIITFSCEQKTTFTDFKFADKGTVVECENNNLKALINEALFSFESDIIKAYGKGRTNLNLPYSQFIRNAVGGRINYSEIVTPHTVKVFEALKQENSLWDANNKESYLNYNSSFFKCVANNIKSENLKTTLNALVSTNTMSPKLFGSPLMSNYSAALSDKHLATYIAFDLYYAKLFNIDLTGVEEKPESKVDFNQIPTIQQDTDPHAGHNH
ncbi:MAG: hypothetical protein WA839_13355 [Flavobacteriaceae bacterium]